MADEKPENVTMKVPPDVLQKIKVIAAIDGKNVYEFNDAELRVWVERQYRKAVAREAKAFDESDDPPLVNELAAPGSGGGG